MLSFQVKFVQTDRWTTVKQYTPDLSMQGHNKQRAIIKKIKQARVMIPVHFTPP